MDLFYRRESTSGTTYRNPEHIPVCWQIHCESFGLQRLCGGNWAKRDSAKKDKAKPKTARFISFLFK
jgi:hypothetical protein